MASDLDRRSFLGLIGVGTAASGLVGCANPAHPPDGSDGSDEAMARSPEPPERWPGAVAASEADFPMDAACGDPLPDNLLFVSKYTGAGTLTLKLGLYIDGAWQAEDHPATPDADGYVRLTVDSLPPDTWIDWQFVDDAGGATPLHRAVTAPEAEHTGEVRLGASSCTDQEHEAHPALTHATEVGPLDGWLFLGDTAYFDSLRTEEQYRALWQRSLMQPGIRDVRQRTSCIVTWDDHEVTNNWDPETIDPDRLEIGRDAMVEANPIRDDPDHPTRLWRSMRFGRTVELFVLDCRGERAPSRDHYISPTQMAWLKQGLADSPCTWKVIANSVPIADVDNPAWDLGSLAEDRWIGYPAQRDELLDFVADEGIEGVAFVSGDVHCGWVARVDKEGRRRNAFDIVVGPGGSFPNPGVIGIVEPDTIPWGTTRWNAAHMTFRHDGTAEIVYTGEALEGDPKVLARFTLTAEGGMTLDEVAFPEETESVR